MKRAIMGIVFFGIVGISASGFIANADDKKGEFKDLMGSNFQLVQKILIDLIRSEYKTIPHDVAIIQDHAEKLTKINHPARAKDQKVYLSMAYNLVVHARNLKTIAETLLQHEPTVEAKTGIRIDYLRDTAAAHFGQMITTCVACHNLFRPPKKTSAK